MQFNGWQRLNTDYAQQFRIEMHDGANT
jgi:hypothetical protein